MEIYLVIQNDYLGGFESSGTVLDPAYRSMDEALARADEIPVDDQTTFYVRTMELV